MHYHEHAILEEQKKCRKDGHLSIEALQLVTLARLFWHPAKQKNSGIFEGLFWNWCGYTCRGHVGWFGLSTYRWDIVLDKSEAQMTWIFFCGSLTRRRTREKVHWKLQELTEGWGSLSRRPKESEILIICYFIVWDVPYLHAHLLLTVVFGLGLVIFLSL